MDFVGDDQQLSEALRQCMAGMRAPLDLSDVEAKKAAMRSLDNPSPLAEDVEIKPDLLSIDLGLQRVNISLDYAELVTMKDLKNEGPKSADFRKRISQAAYKMPREYLGADRNMHRELILRIMQQTVYSVQQRLEEVEPLIAMYEKDARYRLAYIFARLDEWKDEMRTMYYAVRHRKLKNTKIYIYYYERLLRHNIDVTYTIEYVIHMHSEYMQRMEELLPSQERQKLLKAKKAKAAVTAATTVVPVPG
ncbi:hypothetical protein HW555_002700 [Spodoptera exigua]|uniref:Uncharacterized protein n=1 Tax=Spodoptera exigua TaxID=7107 RepID=A0A835GN73_SPOEX|nr:hypothetical protein HW555_002700 [Spodoptera exigua]